MNDLHFFNFQTPRHPGQLNKGLGSVMTSTQVAQAALQGGDDGGEVAEVGSVLAPINLAHVHALEREKTTQWFRNLVYTHGRPVSFCLFVCLLFVQCFLVIYLINCSRWRE